MTIRTKQVIETIEIHVCDKCGANDEDGTINIEECIECGSHICSIHSDYWGGPCVYVNEEGMYCEKCSVGKESVTKWDTND